jgi:PAS domain S-box-containing protein
VLTAKLSDRIRLLQWTAPFAIGILFVMYEIGPGRWIHDIYGAPAYFGVDVFFYAVIVPPISFFVLRQFVHWMEQREGIEKRADATVRHLASITLTSADAILSLDARGRIASWNRGAEMLFGYTADEICGKPIIHLFGGDQAAQVEFEWLEKMTQADGFVRDHETTCRDIENNTIDVDLTATQLRDEAGRFSGMSIILRQATERKRRNDEIQRLNTSLNKQIAERTRELAEKVEELGRANAELQKLDRMRSEFVSLVSHQLRAPLANMNGAVERIEASCGAMTPTCTRMLTILNQQVDRLDRLVRDVLNTAAIESGELALHPEPVSILPIVQQVVEQIRARAALRAFRVPIKPGLPLVFADRDRVIEILANLCDNAVKYSPSGKEIVIETRADETEVTIAVRDFGQGIPSRDLARIFEKFYRADSSDAQAAYGYGLGLYVCRQLVEVQGGRIWAENHPEGGAVFSFTLPVAK